MIITQWSHNNHFCLHNLALSSLTHFHLSFATVVTIRRRCPWKLNCWIRSTVLFFLGSALNFCTQRLFSCATTTGTEGCLLLLGTGTMNLTLETKLVPGQFERKLLYVNRDPDILTMTGTQTKTLRVSTSVARHTTHPVFDTVFSFPF
jgi:hypothetical protein